MSQNQYVFQADLESFLTSNTVINLFDDDGDGVADATPIRDICISASAQADSWILPEFADLVPLADGTAIPAMLKRLALFYAIAESFERHPEYEKKFGENRRATGSRDRAEKLGLQLQEAIRRFSDVSESPANVGGVVTSGGPALLVNQDGEYIGGDF